MKTFDEYANIDESFRKTTSGKNIRNFLQFQSTNRNEFSPGGNFEAVLYDIELIGNASMPIIHKTSVEANQVNKAYEDIKDFAIKRLKNLKSYRPR